MRNSLPISIALSRTAEDGINWRGDAARWIKWTDHVSIFRMVGQTCRFAATGTAPPTLEKLPGRSAKNAKIGTRRAFA
jgi:hypothetical protein